MIQIKENNDAEWLDVPKYPGCRVKLNKLWVSTYQKIFNKCIGDENKIADEIVSFAIDDWEGFVGGDMKKLDLTLDNKNKVMDIPEVNTLVNNYIKRAHEVELNEIEEQKKS